MNNYMASQVIATLASMQSQLDTMATRLDASAAEQKNTSIPLKQPVAVSTVSSPVVHVTPRLKFMTLTRHRTPRLVQ